MEEISVKSWGPCILWLLWGQELFLLPLGVGIAYHKADLWTQTICKLNLEPGACAQTIASSTPGCLQALPWACVCVSSPFSSLFVSEKNRTLLQQSQCFRLHSAEAFSESYVLPVSVFLWATRSRSAVPVAALSKLAAVSCLRSYGRLASQCPWAATCPECTCSGS